MYQLWFFCPKSNGFLSTDSTFLTTLVVSKNYMYKHYINWACLIVLFMFMFSFISVIVSGLSPWIQRFFFIIYCIYIPLAGLKYPATFLCLSQARIWFSNIIWCCLFFMINMLSWEDIVCFVDIGEIVGHHCSNFLFISFAPYCKITAFPFKLLLLQPLEFI